jgi:hypothetical protein
MKLEAEMTMARQEPEWRVLTHRVGARIGNLVVDPYHVNVRGLSELNLELNVGV